MNSVEMRTVVTFADFYRDRPLVLQSEENSFYLVFRRGANMFTLEIMSSIQLRFSCISNKYFIRAEGMNTRGQGTLRGVVRICFYG